MLRKKNQWGLSLVEAEEIRLFEHVNQCYNSTKSVFNVEHVSNIIIFMEKYMEKITIKASHAN